MSVFGFAILLTFDAAEQKKLALVERYSKLKGKQLDRVIERKRKKKASKERKNMPLLRREVES